MKAWRIVNWAKHYELNDQNRPVERMDKARVRPLDWLPLKVKGRDQGPAYRRLARTCRTRRRLETVWAVWCKLLELAADHPRERRGWIVDGDGAPADAETIAEWTGFSVRGVELALTILSLPEIRWIEQPEPTGTYRELEVSGADDTTENETTEERSAETVKAHTDAPVAPGQTNGSLPSSFNPIAFARSVADGLQLGKGNAQQTARDLKAFEKVAQGILEGKMGSKPRTVAQNCLARALEIGRDTKVTNKAAYWLTWARAQIKA